MPYISLSNSIAILSSMVMILIILTIDYFTLFLIYFEHNIYYMYTSSNVHYTIGSRLCLNIDYYKSSFKTKNFWHSYNEAIADRHSEVCSIWFHQNNCKTIAESNAHFNFYCVTYDNNTNNNLKYLVIIFVYIVSSIYTHN